ncbi:MAG: hypothetical protein K6U00_02530 [Armatimonadetes bacterium]|nr:hypothetical protein [Armatimonadota bacterium]
MKEWLPRITALAIAGALVWSLLYLKRVHPLGALAPSLDTDKLAGIAIRLNEAKVVGRSQGKTIWSFDVKTIEVGKNRRITTFSGIRNGKLFRDNKVIASLHANKVVYNTYSNNMLIPNSAEISVVEGPALRINNAVWNARDSVLLAKGGVHATLAGSTLFGMRMTVYLAEKRLEIEKVHGTIKVGSSVVNAP